MARNVRYFFGRDWSWLYERERGKKKALLEKEKPVETNLPEAKPILDAVAEAYNLALLEDQKRTRAKETDALRRLEDGNEVSVPTDD